MKQIYQKSIAACILAVSLLFNSFVFAANENTSAFWKDVQQADSRFGAPDYSINSYRLMQLDIQSLSAVLATVPMENAVSAKFSPSIIEIPMPDGSFGRFSVVESPIMAEELAAKYPEIKTYLGQGIDDPTANARFDITLWGFHAQIRSVHGTVLIDPYNQQTTEHYLVYYRKEANPASQTMNCEFTPEDEDPLLKSIETGEDLKLASIGSIGPQLRTYRLALACTGEYAGVFGGTVPGALSAIVTAMNRVNGIYETEVGVKMILVANNDLILYTSSTTDPFSNFDAGAMINQNQTTIDNIIGSANYDIGHVFSTGGGGYAPGKTCQAGQKAKAVTGLPSPIGDPFYVDYVAHEMGHQFTGSHSFNGTGGNCALARVASAAYEPGSGSTIMAYAGICSPQNLQNNSDPYFHTKSFDEIVAYSTSGTGNSCAVVLSTGNSEPVIDPVPDYTIPYLTPFMLTGSASDPDGDTLTYCWEEYDLGPAGHPNSPGINAPIFRSFNPTLVPYRYFPRIQSIINNYPSLPLGEILPTVARTLNFRLTVRDNKAGGGGVKHNAVTFKVNVINTGAPFLVTSPNTNITWYVGSPATITWDVASTDLAPISMADVNIYLSTDGGFTYPVTLATNVPNNGSATITVPNNVTNTARVMVRGAGNIFFDISNVNFVIQTGTGVNEILSNEIELYPNPATDNMSLILSEKITGNAEINITDVAGRTIYTLTHYTTGKKDNLTLDVSSLSQGLYFVKIKSSNGDAVKRFVKN